MSERGDSTLVYTDIDSGRLRVRRWRVSVTEGPEAGQRFYLERGSLIIGSGSSSDLMLTDPRISRAHVELRLRDKGVQVRDLESTNGTYQGTTRITDSLLQGPTVLRLGSTKLMLEPADTEVAVDTSDIKLGPLVGQSAPMRRLFGTIKQIAASDVSVLLEGETGTGKEELADQLHQRSRRASKSFVVVDCGALAAGLVESELFGHVRGAFTGAHQDREGAFEQADGGTIFLDEIGELPADLQPKLLRALEQRQVRRVGDNRVRHVNARVVAATSRDLDEEVNAGRFRPDLFYRLAVVRLRVPPLRERIEDLDQLVETLIARITDRRVVVTEEAIGQLREHNWPGNVRELRNVLAHALAMRPDSDMLELPTLHMVDLPGVDLPGADLGGEADADGAPRHVSAAAEISDYREAKKVAVAEFEIEYLRRLLDRHAWNVSAAAREAGVDRNYLHRLIKRHGIKR
ncbi:MAG: sigma 54-dependent Fis family transcriptional regulator [Myxococcales bacterium]|nr:sigma 54-dependent Fis family transcriptional regulator [Myxococcales bacterium]